MGKNRPGHGATRAGAEVENQMESAPTLLLLQAAAETGSLNFATVAVLEPLGGGPPGAEPVGFIIRAGEAAFFLSDGRVLDALRRGHPVFAACQNLADAEAIGQHIAACRRSLAQ
jgi:hypothetical protein